MESIAAQAGLILLYLFLSTCLLLTALGLAGNWVIAAVAVVMRLAGADGLSWKWVGVVLVLGIIGEVIEALLGLVVVARKGGSRWGVVGSFVGALVGALAGAGVLPPVGSLVFAFLGAFAGAAAGEYGKNPDGREALRVGFWSFVGKSLATLGKLTAGAGMIAIIVARTW